VSSKKRQPPAAPPKVVHVLDHPLARLRSLAANVNIRRGAPQTLRELSDLTDALKIATAALIDHAHTEGYSWSAIGAQLRISPQAVQQNWSRRHVQR